MSQTGPHSPVRTATATRRTIVGALLATPAVAALAGLAGRTRRNARILRPAGAGTSSGRCATCGSAGHTMLTCPSNPKVL